MRAYTVNIQGSEESSKSFASQSKFEDFLRSFNITEFDIIKIKFSGEWRQTRVVYLTLNKELISINVGPAWHNLKIDSVLRVFSEIGIKPIEIPKIDPPSEIGQLIIREK